MKNLTSTTPTPTPATIPEHGSRRLHIRHMRGAKLVQIGLDQKRAHEHRSGHNQAGDTGREGRGL